MRSFFLRGERPPLWRKRTGRGATLAAVGRRRAGLPSEERPRTLPRFPALSQRKEGSPASGIRNAPARGRRPERRRRLKELPSEPQANERSKGS